MISTLAPRIANMAMRALAMGSRFALVFVMAKLLEPANVGIFGLFLATVSFSVLLIGGDYYTYAQRELMSVPRERWSFVLQHHALASGLLYVVLLPPQLLLFWFDLLPANMLAWFFLLLVVEHLAQEINRLLVAMQRPLAASWVLFIRVGAWVWVLVPIMWLVPAAQTLEAVFLAWLLGGALAVVMGARIIWGAVAPWRRWPLDTAWLKQGFGVGLLFLAATLCFKALTTVDRYVVGLLAGPDLLGVYVLYVWFAMTVVTFLDPAVFSFIYPRIVGTYRRGKIAEYRRTMKELAWSSIGLSVALAVVIAALAPAVLQWIERPIYAEHLSVLWLLLVMAVVYATGMVPHYGLYARGADRGIVVAHVSAPLVFVTTVLALASHAPFEAAACGLLAAFSWIGCVKFLWYRRLVRLDKGSDINYSPHGNKCLVRDPVR